MKFASSWGSFFNTSLINRLRNGQTLIPKGLNPAPGAGGRGFNNTG
jgi:hypothetical protein